LLEKAGLTETASEVQQIRDRRAQHRSTLNEELKLLASRPYTRSWRDALGL
jgi:hypothetical protein